MERNASASPRGRIPQAGILLALAAISFAFAGCSPSGAVKPADSLPGSDAVAGWVPAGEIRTYTHDTLFDYIDGTSEYFFTYSFEAVAVSRYEKSDGAQLNAEVWQLAEAGDAYGLFSGRTAGTAIVLGAANEAALESGSRLLFWQNRFYVSITAFDTVPDGDLRLFGEYISKRLPAGGERPALVGRLPAGGLVPGSEKYFHMEMAIQDRLWLGGENLLGLDADTDGVVARYAAGGAEWQLLLIEYPDSARADAGWQALQDGRVEEVIAADRKGALLGAVFGKSAGTAAEALLAEALGK